MAVFLLDTTTLLHFWRGQASVVAWIDGARRQEHVLAISAVSVAEVYSGTRPVDRSTWDAFFERSLVWAVGREEAALAGTLRFDLARRGVQVHLPDALIAATALRHDATVVTANVKDFVALGIPVLELPTAGL